MYRMLTCPESGHLEMIEYEDSPFGILIASCSRFRPACAVTCPRTCAARFDRRDLPTQVLAVGDETDVTAK